VIRQSAVIGNRADIIPNFFHEEGKLQPQWMAALQNVSICSSCLTTFRGVLLSYSSYLAARNLWKIPPIVKTCERQFICLILRRWSRLKHDTVDT